MRLPPRIRGAVIRNLSLKTMTILAIETSGQACSAALSQDGALVEQLENTEGPSHQESLPGMVRDLLSFADSHAMPVEAVAVSGGPGSYTGLRIGVSTAKGVSYGLGIPLIGIPTLELMCVPVLLGCELPDDALLCPMIDARRMEVYAGVYDRALRPRREVRADVVEPGSYAEWLDRGPVYFFGSGAAKCRGTLNHPAARFLEGIRPSARHIFPLAEQRIARGQTDDTAYYEPFYLKEFRAIRSTKLDQVLRRA